MRHPASQKMSFPGSILNFDEKVSSTTNSCFLIVIFIKCIETIKKRALIDNHKMMGIKFY